MDDAELMAAGGESGLTCRSPPPTPGPGFLVSGENGCTRTSWVATALPTHNSNTRAQSCSTKVCVVVGGRGLSVNVQRYERSRVEGRRRWCSPHGLAGNVRQVCGATLHLCPALSLGGCLRAHGMTSRVVPLLRACAECCPKRRQALNTCSATLCRAPFSREIRWRAVGAKEGQFWPPVWAWGKQGRLQVAGRTAS